MYGAPGLEYGGHIETENDRPENGQSINNPIQKVNPTRPVNSARLIYPEYMCFFPTIFLRGAGACEVDCPEEVRENAKCQRNRWNWAERVAEIRSEREREKVNKNKKETEGSEIDNPENDGR